MGAVESFAGMTLTLSVEALSGGALEIAFGSASGRLQPGEGRSELTLTLGYRRSGPLALQPLCRCGRRQLPADQA